ncbi:MAG: hypothetical protein LBG92_03385 [Prevotellaceae bacterium]|jgi:O-antigen/teichoic acid export membrane protein|nr:hypothetical protein [Prevotellaceae bacterium]
MTDKNKIRYWIKLISVTGIAQVTVQLIGFICGILVIRILPVNEYAFYTIANTILGTMTVLSDGGISTGVMAQGGKVWQNRQKLGAVLATGLYLRRKFAVFSLIISLPVLSYLLLYHGATWITTALISASLMFSFYAALSDNLLQIPVKLHQAIKPLQKNQVEVSAGRLILTGLTLFIFPCAFVAIITSGLPRIWGNFKLGKIANRFAAKNAEISAEDKYEIRKIIKKGFPATVYYAFSGQIATWIISIFGNTESVSKLGALGRIAVLFAVVSTLTATLIVPRFARLKNSENLFKRYIKIVSFFSALILALAVCAYFFAGQILWILGKNYAGLKYELCLNIICSCLMAIMGIAFNLYASKGIVLSPVFSIASNIIPLIAGCLVFNVSTLRGVLYMNLLVATVLLLVQFSFGIYSIKQIVKYEKTD